MNFKASGSLYAKEYATFGITLKADLAQRKLFYPVDIKGRERNDFFDEAHKENLVVFECVNRLLDKGYRPEHIELEKEWHLGHDAKSGRADICVTASDGKMLFIVECKTMGKAFQTEYRKTQEDGGQLFSYWQQERSCQWLVLYAADYVEGEIRYKTDSIDCHDDNNIILASRKDASIKLYQKAHTAEELFAVWDETYEKRFCGDVVFRDDTRAYQIGLKPLRKADLQDFAEQDSVVNQFEEILRHNNVSDKENAFNRLVALFICKLVDEIQKKPQDEVEFQYKVGTDTYESLQDRLQRLHRDGMQEFMAEKIFYVEDDYAENLIKSYTGQRRQSIIDSIKNTIRVLKFYTNNDFAFKDVHNEELFYQNGKILVEVVQLFEKYRIIGSSDLQVLGDLFEQLLNKGFKQNEGQFFTPIPITRFIWDSLPLDDILGHNGNNNYPKIIDYACGAGHFLTQGYEAIEACRKRKELPHEAGWVAEHLFGVEKDYRLARVAKISLFMHGADKGNIIFGDGLENYREKNILPTSFDILVANPPFSIDAFKPHLKLKDNDFTILPKISSSGSEIETLFVERIAQLVKPRGLAAVVLPSSILNKENESFIGARESLLKNFQIRAIAQFGSKTFGATGTNTVIVFLQKYHEPPKRIDLVTDSVQAILSDTASDEWEDKAIFTAYLAQIKVEAAQYQLFVKQQKNYDAWDDVPYFAAYTAAFKFSTEYTNKLRQRSFIAANELEKLRWCNQHFYDFALSREAEKLTYFALTYRQTTLIITAPDDNKAQENFLGYTWSNRKRQEGIQLKTEGGILYNPTDRLSPNTLAALIRSGFAEKPLEIAELKNYYYWQPLKDMLDFSGVEFNKVIKTTKARTNEPREGMESYKLNTANFSISIGDRVLSSEIEENGLYPVYSANVFVSFGRINKQNITDFSKPSIIWGIDGDWMVNYIPANEPFYPTDHCGVLRVNTPDIVPKYLAHALRIEGEYEKFSRSNRASTTRVKNLTVHVPSISQQKQIVAEIDEIDAHIAEQDEVIKRCDEDVKAKFEEMFGKQVFPIKKLGDIGKVSMCKRIMKYETSDSGEVPFYKIGTFGKTADAYISQEKFDEYKSKYPYPKKGDILISAAGTIGKTVIFDGTPSYFQDSNIVWIDNDESEILNAYLYFFYQTNPWEVTEGGTIKRLYNAGIENIQVPLPPLSLQQEFAAYVRANDEKKQAAQHLKEDFIAEREQLVAKYFR
ncbi:MAG: restriction endonuclease subunit S [Selenomonadaceae bacterium]|nr:restriction endonuclease subunit S [Selenomonadaceae bacterium]